MKFILGKKLGMSQVFNDKKEVIPATVIEAGPCFVTQIKTKKNDGYDAVQVGYGFKRKINKPEKRHLKEVESILKNDRLNFRYLREFRPGKNFLASFPTKLGDEINVGLFKEGESVNIQGITKGKGFQGGVKRWGFKGKLSSTHGTRHDRRKLGSIGTQGINKVIKGKKMPGRMGTKTQTIKNLKIIKIDVEKNLLVVKGAIPGQNNRLLKISQQ